MITLGSMNYVNIWDEGEVNIQTLFLGIYLRSLTNFQIGSVSQAVENV